MRKLVCIFLSLLLVFSSSLYLTRNYINAEEMVNSTIILNGGFENGKEGWNISDSGQTSFLRNDTSYPAFNGESCIRLPGYRSNKANSYIYQQILVEKHTDYIITFYAKGNSSAVMRIADKLGFDYGDENDISSSNIIVDESFGNFNDWTRIEVLFNSGEYESLYLEFEPSGGAEPWNTHIPVANRICLDDVMLEKHNEFTIIKNGSFEFGEKNWSFKNKNDVKIIEEESNSYLRLAGYRSNQADAYVYQQITVDKHTDYIIEFYAKGTSSAVIRIADKLGFDYGSESEVADATTVLEKDFKNLEEWTIISTYFNSGDNEKLYIAFDSNNGIDPWNTHALENDRMCIDNIKIEKNNDVAIIKNGTFEDGKYNWDFKNENDAKIIKEESNSYLRLAGYRSNQADAYVYQQITVEKNTDYILKLYARGNSNAKVRISDKLGFDYASENETANAVTVLEKDFKNLEEWTIISTYFNSGDNEKLYIAFDSNNGIEPWNTHALESDRMCIDNIEIVEPSFLTNGDFENELEDWEITNECINISNDSFNGEHSLRLSKDYYEKIGQEISVIDNLTTYRLAFKYKGDITDNMSVWSLSSELYSFDNEVVIYKGTLKSSEDWKDFEIVFFSVYSERMYLNFQTSTKGDWYIDDIVIEPSNDIPQATFEEKEPYFISVTNGHAYYENSNGPYITNDDKNLIKDKSFENPEHGIGTWNNSSFIVEGISVSSEPEAVLTGNYGLEFNSKAENVRGLFTVEVEPQTDYYFTTFVKMPNWSVYNIGDITFGIINPDTGNYLVYSSGEVDNTPYSDVLQLSPSSPDNEWHIACIKFNSADANYIGFMISGNTSTVYFDDMYIFKSEDKILYTDENSNNRTDWKNAEFVANTLLTECDTEINIIQNSDLEYENDEYWTNGLGYNSNVTIANTDTVDHGNVLLYYNDDLYPDRTYYIKWIDIEPNTCYTFSANYMIETCGNDTFFGLLSGSKTNLRYPAKIAAFSLGESNYNNGNWQKSGFTFYSNDCDRVGLAVFNGGGKSYIDALRLFKTYDEYGDLNGKSENIDNTFIVNGDFENGKNGWQLFEGDIISDGTAKSGSSYVRLRGYTWYRLKQNVSIQTNTYYSLSFYIKKIASSSCVITSTDKWLGVDGENVIAYKSFSGNFFGTWSKVNIDFYSENYNRVYIWFDSTGAPTPTGSNNELRESYRTCIDMVSMHVMGDVNEDGKFDVIDLVRLKKYICGMDVTISKLNSDLDHNNSINATDLTSLRKMLLNSF